jgi:tetratricopeptide (TPR) repeat protein
MTRDYRRKGAQALIIVLATGQKNVRQKNEERGRSSSFFCLTFFCPVGLGGRNAARSRSAKDGYYLRSRHCELNTARKFIMNYRMNFALALALACMALGAFAESNDTCFAASRVIQQGPGRGPITASRDPEMEKQSFRSLEAAKFYFYKRKPDKNDKDGWTRINKAVEGRLQEIIDTNPYFARLDDVYFLLGEVYKRMGDQDKAVQNWTKAAEETSDEKLKSEIQKRLDESKSQTKDQKKG